MEDDEATKFTAEELCHSSAGMGQQQAGCDMDDVSICLAVVQDV